MVKLVDTGDLKSPGHIRLYGFKSRSRHIYRAISNQIK